MKKVKYLFLLLGVFMSITLSQILTSFAFKEGKNPSVNPRVLRTMQVKAIPEKLKKHVTTLTSTTKPRNYSQISALGEAANYIESTWKETGLKVERQNFKAGSKTYQNVLTSLGPPDAQRIVIGAHYDVAGDQPGADDNASGIAGLLELARILKTKEPDLKHRIDLVAYCLEEPPFFATSEMGSTIHAKSLKDKKAKVDLMVSLEMIGYFSEKKGSQNYPMDSMKLLYPDKGNFIAVVGQLQDVRLVRKVKTLVSKYSALPVESLNAPKSIPGVDLSDHRSYWEQGFPAVMLTDTAFFRNPNYHTNSDVPETLDYSKMAEVVNGVSGLALEF